MMARGRRKFPWWMVCRFVRLGKFGWVGEAHNLGVSSIPDQRHRPRALITEPETLMKYLARVPVRHFQADGRAEIEELAQVKVSKLLGTFGIRAL